MPRVPKKIWVKWTLPMLMNVQSDLTEFNNIVRKYTRVKSSNACRICSSHWFLCYQRFLSRRRPSWTLMVTCNSIEVSEEILTKVLDIDRIYFRPRKLQTTAFKTKVPCFSFNNKLTKRKLKIKFEETSPNRNETPRRNTR